MQGPLCGPCSLLAQELKVYMSMSESESQKSNGSRRVSALQNRFYRQYAAANSISLIGTWVQRITLAWLAWDLSGTEFWAGLIAFASFAPLLLSPYFGAFADRITVRRLGLMSNTVMLLLSVLLLGLALADLMSIGVLLVMSLALGVTNASYVPARIALVNLLVDRELLPSAIAINSIIFNTSRLAGPVLAGLVLAKAGIEFSFLLNCLSFIPLIFVIRSVPPYDPEPREPSRLSDDIKDAWAYILDHPVLRKHVFLAAWSGVFLGGTLELLSVYSQRFYGMAADGLAALSAASGLGALFASFGCSQLRQQNGKLEQLSILGRLLTAVAIVLFPLVPMLIWGMAMLSVIGFATTGSSVLSQTVIQLEVSNAYRSRVASVWGISTLGSIALGSLLLGSIAEQVGIAPATVLTGLIGSVLPLTALLGILRRKSFG